MPRKKSIDVFKFQGLEKGVFQERPNRFVAMVKRANGRIVKAYLPNPGRLGELLLPGAELFIAPNPKPGAATTHLALAVRSEFTGEPVFLDTHKTNLAARRLLEERLVHGLEDAVVERAEVPVGRSRFDFLLSRKGKPLYLEVKSCTLFSGPVAMFPDAVTARGKKHLDELAAMTDEGINVAVLFFLHSGSVETFMPDYHTDLAFSETFLAVRGRVPVYPVGVGWDERLRMKPGVGLARVPWGYLQREVRDGGAYLLVFRLERPVTVEVGSLGKIDFKRGYYVYVGSALKNLTKRIERHKRACKKKHWHIDYLLAKARGVNALPIRSSRRDECDLAQDLSKTLKPWPVGFGSSDCGCPTHLYYSGENPEHTKEFYDVLFKYRMRTA